MSWLQVDKAIVSQTEYNYQEATNFLKTGLDFRSQFYNRRCNKYMTQDQEYSACATNRQ